MIRQPKTIIFVLALIIISIIVMGYAKNNVLPWAAVIQPEDVDNDVCDFTTNPSVDWQKDLKDFIADNPGTRAASPDGIKTFCFGPGTYSEKIVLDKVNNIRLMGPRRKKQEAKIEIVASRILNDTMCQTTEMPEEQTVYINESSNLIFKNLTLRFHRPIDDGVTGKCVRFDSTVAIVKSNNIVFKKVAINSQIQYPTRSLPFTAHKVSRAITVYESKGVSIEKSAIESTGKQAIHSNVYHDSVEIALKNSTVRCYYFCIDANYNSHVVATKTTFINDYMYDAPPEQRRSDNHMIFWLSQGARIECEDCTFKFLNGFGLLGVGASDVEDNPSTLIINGGSVEVARGLRKILMPTHPNYYNARLYITGKQFDKFRPYLCISWQNLLCRDVPQDRGGAPPNVLVFMREDSSKEFREIPFPVPVQTKIISKNGKCIGLTSDEVVGQACNDSAQNQKWFVVGVNHQYHYTIKSVSSGKCLTMKDSPRIVLRDCVAGDRNQEFKIQYIGSATTQPQYNRFRIGTVIPPLPENTLYEKRSAAAALVNKCVDIRENNNRVVILDCKQNDENQIWNFDSTFSATDPDQRSVIDISNDTIPVN